MDGNDKRSDLQQLPTPAMNESISTKKARPSTPHPQSPGRPRHDDKVLPVREAMLGVMGNLEVVLGEMREVMGELQVLVSRIDDVTKQIDDEYLAELTPNESSTTQCLQNGEQPAVSCRKDALINNDSSDSSIYTRPRIICFSAGYSGSTSTVMSDASSSYSRSLQSSCLSSDYSIQRDSNFDEFIKCRDSQIKIFNQPTSSPTSALTRENSDGDFRNSSVITCGPHLVELQRIASEYRQPQSDCLYSNDRLWRLAACLPSPSSTLSPGSSCYQDCSGHHMIPLMLASEQSTLMHYCGIYEDELDRSLEMSPDDIQDKKLDDRCLLNQTWSEYQAYCRERVSLWAACTVRDININPAELMFDTYLESPATDTNSEGHDEESMTYSDVSSPFYWSSWLSSLTKRTG